MLIAALPPAEPPARVVAGVRIAWPLSKPETTVSPGTTLKVRVKSRKRRARVSFVRVSASGKPLRRVKTRTLRRGSFRVKVPAAEGARYALRIKVAGRTRWSWVLTPAPVAPVPPAAPVAPAPVPSPAPTPPPRLPFCPAEQLPASAFAAELRLSAPAVKAGDKVTYTVANVGQGAILDWGRGRATAVPPDAGLIEIGPQPIKPLEAGETRDYALAVPADALPGRYRLEHTIGWADCDMIKPLLGVAPAELEVTAP